MLAWAGLSAAQFLANGDPMAEIDFQRASERNIAQRSGNPTPSRKTIEFYTALGMYSEFIRNLEFADKELKRTHLENCLGYWELALRGWLQVLKEAMPNALKDLEADPKQNPAITAPNTKKRKSKPEDWTKLVLMVESVFKYAMPYLSMRCLPSWPSEPTADSVARH
jgi:hypothetical protein